MENKKTTIICGTDHEMSEEEKNNFIKMMSDNDKYNVVFDEENTIPKLVIDVCILPNININDY